MNKSELVEEISNQADLNKAEAARALEAVVSAIADTLQRGQSVSVVGFGTFLVRERKARTGRNPRTGETINISASKVPAFKAGKNLKDALN